MVEAHAKEIKKLNDDLCNYYIGQVRDIGKYMAENYMLLKLRFLPLMYKVEMNSLTMKYYVRTMLSIGSFDFNTNTNDFNITYISVDVHGNNLKEHKGCFNIYKNLFKRGFHSASDVSSTYFDDRDLANAICNELNK